MKRQVMALALGVALFGAGYAQAGVLIDSFDAEIGEISRHLLGAEPLGMATNALSIVPSGASHTRTLLLEVLQTDANINHLASTDVTVSTFSLNNDSGIASRATLTYDNLGGVDLTGPGTLASPTTDTKPWLIFHASTVNLDLVVTVTLTDTAGNSSTNTYVKLDELTSKCAPPPSPAPGFPLVLNGTSVCPEIVGPIFQVSPNPSGEANYYHALEAFVNPTTSIDPVTGQPFGSKDPLFTAASLEIIDTISIAFTAPTETQDFTLTCIHTGAAPSGAQPNADPFAIDFVSGDEQESDQCTVVPEPGTLLLLGTGFLGLGLISVKSRLRRRQQA